MAKKILIVNDDPDIVKVVTARLKKLNYELMVATDGQQAVDLAQQYQPDLIVMDYHLPILNGMEAIRIIKKDEQLKNIPVLLLTASLNVSEIKAVEADDYIEMVDLIEKIKKWTKT